MSGGTVKLFDCDLSHWDCNICMFRMRNRQNKLSLEQKETFHTWGRAQAFLTLTILYKQNKFWILDHRFGVLNLDNLYSELWTVRISGPVPVIPRGELKWLGSFGQNAHVIWIKNYIEYGGDSKIVNKYTRQVSRCENTNLIVQLCDRYMVCLIHLAFQCHWLGEGLKNTRNTDLSPFNKGTHILKIFPLVPILIFFLLFLQLASIVNSSQWKKKQYNGDLSR